MNEPAEAVTERRMDVALEEVFGRHEPPDLVAAIGARLDASNRPRRTHRWLAAAVLVLGVAATWAIATWGEDAEPQPAPADEPVDEQQDKKIPPHRDATSRAEIEKLPLDTVHVRGHLLKDADLAALTRLPALRFLDLSRCKVTEGCFVHLAKLHKLESLVLNRQRVSGAGFVMLKALPNLARVELRRTSIAEPGLAALAKLPAVRYLDISDCRYVTDTGMRHVLRMRGLRHLELAGNGLIGEGLLLQLGALTQLRHLGVANIRGEQELQRIQVDDVVYSKIGAKTGDAVGVDDRVLAVIAKHMPHLRLLDITGCFHATDLGVRKVLALKHLAELRVARCHKLTNGLARDIARRPGWVRLGLATADVTALRLLAEQQPGLRDLELTGERGVDLDLRPLTRLPALRALTLYRANVRDTDILALKDCPKLEFIVVGLECQRTGWNRLVGHILVTYSEREGAYVTFRR